MKTKHEKDVLLNELNKKDKANEINLKILMPSFRGKFIEGTYKLNTSIKDIK